MEADARKPKRVTIGPTGETVRANIAAIRKERGLTLRGLSELMADLGWPMSNSSLSQIEKGSRRVDVDDLMALAAALDVSPNTLLMPAGLDTDREVKASGIQSISAKNLWYFLEGMRSSRTDSLDFPIRSLPPFSRLVQGENWRSAKNPAELLVSREMETDGREVTMQTGFGYSSIFAGDEDD